MSQFAKKLKDAGKLWNAAKTRAAEAGSGRYAEFDDGRYMTRITDAKIGESQSSGRLQVVWTFKFEDGQYEGQTKLDFSGLETDTNLYYLAQRLQQLGYEPPDSLEEIEDILEDVKKTRPLVKINLKTKGDFQNVYIDKVFASGLEESGEEPEDDDTAEEETPAPAPKKGKAAAPPPEPEEEEEAEEEEAEEEEEEAEEDDDSEVEEDEDEAEDGDEVELTVGMSVSVETSKGSVAGEVLEILETEGKVRVRTAEGKTLRVPFDKIVVEDAVPEEPKKAPAPAPKKGKK